MPAITPVPVPTVRGASGLTFQASSAWGDVFTHSQGASLDYVIFDWYPPFEGGALFSCGSPAASSININVCTSVSGGSAKKVLVNTTWWASRSIGAFHPSGFTGCDISAVSAGTSSQVSATCDTSAMNTYQCMSAVVSSLDSSTGMGTSGTMTFTPALETRLALPTDVAATYSEISFNIVLDSPFGANNEYVDDPNIMRTFINTINAYYYYGGWRRYPDILNSPTPSNVLAGQIPIWRGTYLC
jgi:hypothetical protein